MTAHATDAAPLNSAQVCRMAGVTYRQLDYWARTGVVTPSVNKGAPGRGHGRRWSVEDVQRVRIVGLLMAWNAWEGSDALTSVSRRVLQEFDEMPTDEGWLVARLLGGRPRRTGDDGAEGVVTTLIEWTDETWNPTTGCDRVSPGCIWASKPTAQLIIAILSTGEVFLSNEDGKWYHQNPNYWASE